MKLAQYNMDNMVHGNKLSKYQNQIPDTELTHLTMTISCIFLQFKSNFMIQLWLYTKLAGVSAKQKTQGWLN